MGGITISAGKTRTEVTRQAALYKIEEETAGRLVLRAKKIGAIGGGIILCVMGLGMSAGTYGVAAAEESIGITVIAGAIALLLLAGGIALLRSGIRNQDRIVFDRGDGQIRFEKTRKKDSFSIPFSDVEKFLLKLQDKSLSSKEVNIVFRILIVTKTGDEFQVDEGFNQSAMKSVALKAAAICGVPVDEAA